MIPLIHIVLAALAIWGLRKLFSRSRLPYPPGPKPKPLIGNSLDFPLVNAAQKYMEWSETYRSNILHIEALGNHVVVLNKLEDADELLEKRASNYSDRPMIPIIKLFGWEFNIALLGYNDQWRLHRKICQQNFRQAAAHKYHPLQIEKVHEMLQSLLERPKEFDDHNKILSISIPLSSMYGYDVKSLDDPCIQAAEKSTNTGAILLLPGNSFVNIIPALGKIPAWVPFTTSVRTAAEVKQWTEEMKRIPTEFVTRKFAEGKVIPSLVTDMLERKFSSGVTPEEEEAVQNVAYTVYGGKFSASDTTIALTKSFFYLMAKHPDIQKKAQAEIDRVVGSKRLPDFEDRGSMPYVEAIYRELQRYAPSVPLGVPHATSEDDHYKGYLIPKGASVFANIWAMTRDENRYPDPYTFKPERFLDESGQINDDDRILAFGFGRRVCVGKHVASSTMWLMMVSVLACFNIGKAKDENGNYIEIDDEYEEFGLIRHKAHCECSFTVRSPEARQLIMSSVATLS
ncbi:cytochrome P450 [Agrocybe pediades]|nr:cytochrome P450 [Agrocybe pediades]